MNTFVVARYRENLDWIAEVPNEFNIYVYNKGEAITSTSVEERATEIISRPNFGRESETYLHHLLRTKLEGVPLGDHVVFSQGNPFESSPDFLNLLKQWRDWHSVQPLSWRKYEAENIPPVQLLDLDRDAYLEGSRLRPELFSLTTLGPLQFLDLTAVGLGEQYKTIHQLSEEANIVSHFFSLCGLNDLAVLAADYSVGSFAYSGMFAIDHRQAASLSVETLRRMHTISRGHAVYGKLFERAWLHMFGQPFEVPLLQPV